MRDERRRGGERNVADTGVTPAPIDTGGAHPLGHSVQPVLLGRPVALSIAVRLWLCDSPRRHHWPQGRSISWQGPTRPRDRLADIMARLHRPRLVPFVHVLRGHRGPDKMSGLANERASANCMQLEIGVDQPAHRAKRRPRPPAGSADWGAGGPQSLVRKALHQMRPRASRAFLGPPNHIAGRRAHTGRAGPGGPAIAHVPAASAP